MRTAGLTGARCVGLTDLFFSTDPVEIEEAKAICAMCPAFRPCKTAGQSEKHGVWAAQHEPGKGPR